MIVSEVAINKHVMIFSRLFFSFGISIAKTVTVQQDKGSGHIEMYSMSGPMAKK